MLAKENSNLSDYFITGFADGESYFSITWKNEKLKTGWAVKVAFGINLHEKDRAILEEINKSLGGVGIIGKHGKTSVRYIVSYISEGFSRNSKSFQEVPINNWETSRFWTLFKNPRNYFAKTTFNFSWFSTNYESSCFNE